MSALDFELSWLPVRYVLWLGLIQYDASGSESSAAVAAHAFASSARFAYASISCWNCSSVIPGSESASRISQIFASASPRGVAPPDADAHAAERRGRRRLLER